MEHNEAIVKYFRLCSARLGTRKHIVDTLSPDKLRYAFPISEQTMYLRKQDGHLVPRESIIGGYKEGDKTTILPVIGKALVF